MIKFKYYNIKQKWRLSIKHTSAIMQDDNRQPCIRYRQRHNRHSNDYRQLFAINDDSNGYQYLTISEGRVNRQRKPTTNDEVRQGTINSLRQQSNGNRKSACLLTIRASLSKSNMADSNVNQHSTIIIMKLATLKSKTATICIAKMRKGKGKSGNGEAVVAVAALRCPGHRSYSIGTR